jgi:flagellar biogenesis protein FliO
MLRIFLLLALMPILLLAEETVPMEDYNFVTEFVRMISILGAMIGVLLLVAWGLKRVMNTRMEQINETSNIRIIERRALTPKANLYLLEVEGKKMVVAESPAGIHHLTNFETEREEAHEMV